MAKWEILSNYKHDIYINMIKFKSNSNMKCQEPGNEQMVFKAHQKQMVQDQVRLKSRKTQAKYFRKHNKHNVSYQILLVSKYL